MDVRVGSAEELPFPDDSFEAALAQLVVHFMVDAVGGLREMARVARPGGVVAACVWDMAGGRAPISPFWKAALQRDAKTRDESGLPGAREGHLTLFRYAGLRELEETEHSATVEYETFEEWWEPYTLGVGPAGAHARSLAEEELAAVRVRCRSLLPEPPFAFTAFTWAPRGLA